MNAPPAETPRQYATLTETQLAFLDQWAMGRFRADYNPGAKPPVTIEAGYNIHSVHRSNIGRA